MPRPNARAVAAAAEAPAEAEEEPRAIAPEVWHQLCGRLPEHVRPAFSFLLQDTSPEEKLCKTAFCYPVVLGKRAFEVAEAIAQGFAELCPELLDLPPGATAGTFFSLDARAGQESPFPPGELTTWGNMLEGYLLKAPGAHPPAGDQLAEEGVPAAHLHYQDVAQRKGKFGPEVLDLELKALFRGASGAGVERHFVAQKSKPVPTAAFAFLSWAMLSTSDFTNHKRTLPFVYDPFSGKFEVECFINDLVDLLNRVTTPPDTDRDAYLRMCQIAQAFKVESSPAQAGVLCELLGKAAQFFFENVDRDEDEDLNVYQLAVSLNFAMIASLWEGKLLLVPGFEIDDDSMSGEVAEEVKSWYREANGRTSLSLPLESIEEEVSFHYGITGGRALGEALTMRDVHAWMAGWQGFWRSFYSDKSTAAKAVFTAIKARYEEPRDRKSGGKSKKKGARHPGRSQGEAGKTEKASVTSASARQAAASSAAEGASQ